jgi:hypothetical protein
VLFFSRARVNWFRSFRSSWARGRWSRCGGCCRGYRAATRREVSQAISKIRARLTAAVRVSSRSELNPDDRQLLAAVLGRYYDE